MATPTIPWTRELDDSSPATIAAERALLLAGKVCFAARKGGYT